MGLTLDEVLLLRVSTTAGEFRWSGVPEEDAAWEARIKAHERGESTKDGVEAMRYALQLRPHIWLSVQCRENRAPTLSLQAAAVAQPSAIRLKAKMEELERRAMAEGFGHPVFEVFTGLQSHLASYESADRHTLGEQESTLLTSGPTYFPGPTEEVKEKYDFAMLRVIFWSHHLKAPSKKRDVKRWCAELDIFGLIKSGYPGFLCFEGKRDSVQEIVRRIKALQWHAITVKTEVPYSVNVQRSHPSSRRPPHQNALLRCKLAAGHSCLRNAESQEKLRISMDEVEDSSELVQRLRAADIPEEELLYALNLRG